jgi:tetratricopeptide (TPR) repeat protein
MGARETSNLDAFRCASEARVKLDTLDPGEMPAAIQGFERAVRLDPRYAIAYAGLANAHFLLYEATRVRNQADAERLTAAIGHARRAVDLDDTMAEGHATLSFLLVAAGRLAEAVTSARRAVALDPHDWRHLFRLGHAAWGSERVDALRRALAIYGDIAYAYYEIAMVHIARRDLPQAAEVLRQGLPLQDQQAGRSSRYPAIGLHWLLGMTCLAQGDAEAAIAEFEREVDTGAPTSLFRTEFLMNTHDGRGFALLALRRHDEAVAAFGHALRLVPGHARSHAGLALCHLAAGRKSDADVDLAQADQSIAQLAGGGRLLEAASGAAMVATVRGRHTEALSILNRILTEAPPGFPGWNLSIEPIYRALHAQPEFGALLAKLADRAR